MERMKYPKTQEEAFKILDELLTDEEKRDALQIQDDEVFASGQHFDLGLWVRNNWIYGDKVEQSVLTGAQTEHKPGETEFEALLYRVDADCLSSKFVALYHKHLRETLGYSG